MANKATSLIEEAIEYLGKAKSALLKQLSKEDWAWYKKFSIKPQGSYFVKGSKEDLEKFRVLFLGSSVYEKPLFKEFQMFDYIKRAARSNAEDEFACDCDLLILYAHNKQIGVGNTERWALTSLVEKIAERNRMGLISLILSERNLDIVEMSNELEIIDLGGWTQLFQVQDMTSDIAERAKNKQETENILEQQNIVNGNKPVTDDVTVY